MRACGVVSEGGQAGASLCARYETRLDGVGRHTNRALCVLIGQDRPITLRAGGERFEGDALLVRPGVEHCLDFRDQVSSVLYFEQVLWPSGDFAPARSLTDAERLVAERCAPGEPEAVRELSDRMGLPSLEPGDLSCVLRDIDADPMARMGQEALARRLGCDRTTALRKFKSRTGQTFRGYKQWRALRHATQALLQGAPIGVSALDAGFADAAHFSRVFRASFGVSPSQARTAQA